MIKTTKPFNTIPALDAVRAASANKSSRWPERSKKNRLEPECWPQISSSFTFSKQENLFVIGSCFARDVESHLYEEGFAVMNYGRLREHDAGARQLVNRYSPTAIYQELQWVREIYLRDGHACLDDIKPFAIEMPGGGHFDMLCRTASSKGVELEDLLDTRKGLYDVFSSVLKADVTIIILETIEGLWDRQSQLYVQFDPTLISRSNRDRFLFTRLSFTESLDYVQRTVELVKQAGCERILLTTSPLPNPRTFSRDDAIVANTYAKSVLRAVVGQVVEEFENVDYFPCFESVSQTRQNAIWEDDLIHVQPEFIARIMHRVTEEYTGGHENRNEWQLLESALEMAGLVRKGHILEARRVYGKIGKDVFSISNNQVHLAAAQMFNDTGDNERALAHVEKVDLGDASFCKAHPEALYFANRIFRQAGNIKAADLAFESFTMLCRDLPHVMIFALAELDRRGLDDEFIMLLERADREKIQSNDLCDKIAHWYIRLKRPGDAVMVCQRQLVSAPDNMALQRRLAKALWLDDRLDEAVVVLEKVVERNGADRNLLLTLVKFLRKQGRFKDAETMCEQLISSHEDDGQGHALLARFRWRRGDREGARQVAKKALELGGDDRSVRHEVGNIIKPGPTYE